MIFNKKIVIGGIVGFSVAIATTITLIVVLNKKEDKKESKVIVDTSNLRASSYEVRGLNGGGTFAKKSDVSLPLQVEAKYAKGLSTPTLDNQYSTSLPTDLSNDDKVFIKFFIKLAYTASHKLPTVFANPIEFGVTGLETSPVSPSDLSTAIAMFNDFSSTDTAASGENDFTSLSIGSADVMDKFIAITGYSAPSLETGVSISKVIIKTAYSSATRQVVFTITLQKAGAASVTNNSKDITVTFAKITIDTSNLISSSYEVIRLNGTQAFSKKDDASLPLQVDAKYAKSSSLPILDSDYSLTFPTGLANDDKVFIKFFIKSAYTASHKFPTIAFTNPVEFGVADLKNHNALLLVELAKLNDFSSTDTAFGGTNDFTSLLAGPTDVKAKFIAITGYNASGFRELIDFKVTISTAYSSVTKQIKFRLTFWYMESVHDILLIRSENKDITVTFAST